ncbi:hypothetical protein RxyAA322_24340 [Rubrobacter xylanophilus]|uniref:Uncharacterized protein n=1 Tax=Rubrobacter xylanophilus TaxID=49319 RepID=A0A510HKP1_9ACTN|nr:hypothetical protein RxyAA322_03490 [Rubrobacter xylanophilus]BBL80580.1 hypothetical protein RxyAA322_24340 [Rubrobacter xylanophilus]
MTKTATVWFLKESQSKQEGHTMADELRVGLSELLRKAQMQHDTDFLRESVRTLRERR